MIHMQFISCTMAGMKIPWPTIFRVKEAADFLVHPTEPSYCMVLGVFHDPKFSDSVPDPGRSIVWGLDLPILAEVDNRKLILGMSKSRLPNKLDASEFIYYPWILWIPI